jgi:DNA-binding XRE family transcriptional regulator
MTTPTPLKTVQWLDLVKEKTGAKTDADLARTLGIKKQTISQQRKGKHSQEPLQALRTARIMEICPIIVIAAACWERAKDDAIKSEWATLYYRNSGSLVIPCAEPGDIEGDGIRAAVACELKQ